MSIGTVILGASGYVGGELLRLLINHPGFELAAAVSAKHCGEKIGSVFPHLDSAYAHTRFVSMDSWTGMFDQGDRIAIFSAAAHGRSARQIKQALGKAADIELDVHVVDSSADFRFSSLREYETVYGCEHPARELVAEFSCVLPEHASGTPTRHVGHPGCFATAILLSAVPLYRDGLLKSDAFVTGITGSTGAGRQPRPGTHHPERHNNLYAYSPLVHRHVAEVHNLIRDATGQPGRISFVPHSGPFARGIYATLQATLDQPASSGKLLEIFDSFYADAEFVHISKDVPKLKHVVASNYARISVSTLGKRVAVHCAIDNLVKGAAGGAIQWMNRLWSLPETNGLTNPPSAWI